MRGIGSSFAALAFAAGVAVVACADDAAPNGGALESSSGETGGAKEAPGPDGARDAGAADAAPDSGGAVSETTLLSPQWTFSDDFEGARDGSFWLGDGISLDYGSQDPSDPTNKVMAMHYVPNSEGEGDSWSEYDFKVGIDAVQLELSFRMYVPASYVHVELNHKVFALWSGPYGTATANVSVSSEAWGGAGGASPSVYVGVDGSNFGHAMRSQPPNLWGDGEARWMRVHVFLELARSQGEYGRLEISKDGKLITGTHHPELTRAFPEAPDGEFLIRYASRGNFIDQGTILGWANGAPEGGFTTTTTFLIDDLVVRANAVHGATASPHF